MIVDGRFPLDTNILVYAADKTGGDRHVMSEDLVNQASSVDCVVMVQALGEFIHSTTRKRGMLDAAKAIAYVNRWRGAFTIASANESSLADAMRAYKGHSVSF